MGRIVNGEWGIVKIGKWKVGVILLLIPGTIF
jgi:hypothetical protein